MLTLKMKTKTEYANWTEQIILFLFLAMTLPLNFLEILETFQQF